MSSLAKRFARSVLDFVCPQICVFCGYEQPRGPVCDRCRALLPRNCVTCRHCAEPLPMVLPEDVACAACLERPPPFAFARAPFVYSFPIDSALKSLKFHSQFSYVPAFGEYLLDELDAVLEQVDALAPVPLHRWRHARRGFNQAVELCRPLQRATNLPVIGNLRRVKATPSQTGLSAAQRRRNLRDAFAVTGPLRCRRPLIVDDVMTTGETCRHLAQVLLQSGAEQVGVLVLARRSARRHPEVSGDVENA